MEMGVAFVGSLELWGSRESVSCRTSSILKSDEDRDTIFEIKSIPGEISHLGRDSISVFISEMLK